MYLCSWLDENTNGLLFILNIKYFPMLPAHQCAKAQRRGGQVSGWVEEPDTAAQAGVQQLAPTTITGPSLGAALSHSLGYLQFTCLTFAKVRG